MSEKGIFRKSFNGFEPNDVLDYIEQLQNDKFKKENELLSEINSLKEQNRILSSEVENQKDINDNLKKQIKEFESQLADLSELVNSYSEESHKAVSIGRGPQTNTAKPQEYVYKLNGKSKFDTIKDKLTLISDVMQETKKIFFNK